jgi:translation initiation factor 1
MGLFDGTPLERPVTCERCGKTVKDCHCPRDASGKILLPASQTAIVRTENRGKGKLVTLVEGLDPVASDLNALLKSLKSKCASGGTTKGESIEIQGDHRASVAQLLESLGYRTKIR